jgi:hypothetical protein
MHGTPRSIVERRNARGGGERRDESFAGDDL